MGRAEDLFRRLSDGGEGVIDALIVDRESEELFLDFKRSADNGSGNHLHDRDRANLAKAISGFGNSEGGIIVWGVDVTRQQNAGDVAGSKVPIYSPRRFLSWLEGAVSGCTVPPHPNVQQIAIVRGGSDVGFVVTYIAKSYFAPHQCLRPPQFLIRAGSSFVPAPYGVLAGLFGRHPQPEAIHMWVVAPATYQQHRADKPFAAEFTLGFLLANQGPAIARDLYVNVTIAPPSDSAQIGIEIPDKDNWTGHFAFGAIASLVSKDAFKLAPQAFVQPLRFRCRFAPPFEAELFYRITFGAQGTPVRSIETHVDAAALRVAFDAFAASDHGSVAGRRFVVQVMDIRDLGKVMTPEEAYGTSP